MTRPAYCPNRLAGRVAVVTGAASGIGLATAQRLSAEGAAVLLADIDEAGLEQASAALRDAGGRCAAAVTDVADEAAVVAMVAACREHFAALHILVNNAADVSAGLLGRDRGVVDMELEIWERTLTVNLRSQMLACREAVPLMLAAGGGAIVNVASVAALAGDVVRAAYSAAKAGTVSLTQHVAAMYGKQGIRCNAVAPGLVLGRSATEGLPASTMQRLLDNHLSPRLGQPGDIAAVIAFLASEDAAFVSGQVLVADGGAVSHLPSFAQQLRHRRGEAATGG